jgi:HSP20 family protein
MTLVRFDPFRDLSVLQNRVNRLFTDTRALVPEDDAFQSWAPAVDIFERGDDLILSAELPGVRREELDLKVEGNVLTLRGERLRDKTIQEDQYHRVERTYGTFSRSFTLPSTVDPARIEARFKDGILEVVLPKAEDAKPKKIEVKVS